MTYDRTICPRCNRQVCIRSGYYAVHASIDGNTRSGRCPLSHQLAHVKGTTDDDHETRAQVVAHLACQLRDEDPALVWEYLTATTAVELQRLLMVALAGIPIETKSLDDIFGWVTELPDAQRNTA